MKLSCLPVSYFRLIREGKLTIEQWASQAAALGLDAIDLSILFFRNRDSRKRAADIRKEIENYGIYVSVVNMYTDFTHPDPHERKQQLCQLQDDLAVAEELGAKMVRLTAGQGYPQISRKEGIHWAVAGLRGARGLWAGRKLTLLFENHSKPGIWKYPDFCLPTDIFLEIAVAIQPAGIRILFDTANPLVYGEEPVPLLEKVLDRVECLHVADIQKRGALDPVIIGKGIVPIPEIFCLLQKAGYDGNISIEEASGCGEDGIAKAIQYVRTAWMETGKKN